MSNQQIITDHAADGAYVVTMDYGDGAAVLSHAMTDALAAALEAVPTDARCLVLQSTTPDFCAGRASPMPAAGSRIVAADIRRDVAEPVLDFYATLRAVPVPVIARVTGRAHGVGCAIVGLADLALADDSLDLHLPEMDRDIPPLLVLTALSGRVPRAVLANLAFGRAVLDGPGARAAGLIAEQCDRKGLDARLAEIRAALASNTPTTTRTVKRFLNATPELGFESLREYAAAAISGAVAERFPGKDTQAEDRRGG